MNMNSVLMAFDKPPQRDLSRAWKIVAFLVTVGKSSIGGAGASIALTGLLNIIFGFWIGSHLSKEHLDAFEAITVWGAAAGAVFGCIFAYRRYI